MCGSLGVLSAQNTLDKVGLTAASPASAAYSLRKLSSSYLGYACRVRRSSDNATQDIGFTAGGDLDAASLLSFTGSGDGFISIWYDQSGNGLDLTQTDITKQPRIVSAGSIDMENSRPFIRFFGTMNSSNYKSLELAADMTTVGFVAVVNKFASGGDGFLLGHTGSYYWHTNPPGALVYAGVASPSYSNAKFWQNGNAVLPTSAVFNTTLMINGVAPQTPNSSVTWNNIGSDRNFYHATTGGGGYAELLIFNSPLIPNDRILMERNQANYFNITLAASYLDKNGKTTANNADYVNRYGAIGGSGTKRTGESVSSQPVTAPVTSAISAIGSDEARSGATFSSDGGGSVEAGICWSTTSNPTIYQARSIDAGSPGSFSSTMSNLSANTTYYVRAYLSNNAGVTYGNENSFTTLAATAPRISLTTEASSIKATSAVVGGNISGTGGVSITARGICWGLSSAPTIADNTTSDAQNTVGSYSNTLTGLALNTVYYARSYATNSAGTSYGPEISFTTRSTLALGDSYQGGIIGYIFVNGDPGYVSGETHGLIVTPTNVSSSVRWYNSAFLSVTTGSAIGTGLSNSNAIVSAQGSGTYAAKLCRSLSLNGYTDWYLLSKMNWIK